MPGLTLTRISTTPIDAHAALQFAVDPTHGAMDMFVGSVRNHNQGKPVTGISYDVFDDLALNVFKKLAEEARQSWGEDLNIYIEHFKGRQPVGGVSVIIAVSSRHRDASFQACRFIIEEIKHRAPIWKQEHYVEGDSEWIQGYALNTPQ